MERTENKLRLCVILLVLNVLFIWGNSLLPGSVSGAISGWVKDILASLFSFGSEDPEGGHGLLRKLAHFTEFMTLGLCLRWLWGMVLQKLPKQLILSLSAAFLTACIDETIQAFVPGRGPGFRDVMIDTAGAVLGIMILTLIHYSKSRKLEEHKL